MSRAKDSNFYKNSLENIVSEINNLLDTTISDSNFQLGNFLTSVRVHRLARPLTLLKHSFTFVCKAKAQDIGIQAMVLESNLSQTCKDDKFVIHTTDMP